MKFRFVLKDEGTRNQGWWLKISSVGEYFDYKYALGFDDPLVQGVYDYATQIGHHNHLDYLPTCLYIMAQNRGISIIEAANLLGIESSHVQLDLLDKGYNLYFNRVGGWHYGKNDFTQWIDKEELVFPNFKKNEIKIKQFIDGTHFYAYIDNMQVRDGDTLKWNTYEEAYNKALQVIGK